MLDEAVGSRFKRDLKLMHKQQKDISKLTDVIEKLKNSETLDAKYRDHALMGKYKGSRECHIESDWLFIYRIDTKESKLYLIRTGSHSELFSESISIKQLNKEFEQFID